MNAESNGRPFGMRDKLGYMFGDFGNDFTFIFGIHKSSSKQSRSVPILCIFVQIYS